MNYKIRFHLAKGVNFMKWQIKDTKSGEVIYISPKDYSLHFEGVTLKNSKSTANRIKQGSNKTVCAAQKYRLPRSKMDLVVRFFEFFFIKRHLFLGWQ